MLANLLPGLRELRVPLAAGFLWLLAIWFWVEPLVPDAGDASGALASAYRLSGVLSVIGLGAGLTFAAYIVGSLSVFLFSRLLESMIATSEAPVRNRFDALTDRSLESLRLTASDSREKLSDALGLSRVTVLDLVRERGVAAGTSGAEDFETHRPRKFLLAAESRALRTGFLRPRSRPAPGPIVVLPGTVLDGLGGPAPPPPEVTAEGLIRQRIVADLPDLLDIRLLGRDTDLYARLDRGAAEIGFRLAIVPPVLALAIALGLRLPLPGSVIAVVLGLSCAAGLTLDAVRHRRTLNELVLALLADGRLTTPYIDRLERAAKRLSPSFATPLKSQAQTTLQVVQRLFAGLAAVAASEPAHSRAAVELHTSARRAFDDLVERVDRPDDLEAGRRMLDRLGRVAAAWEAMNQGQGPPTEDLRAEVDRAREDYELFVETLRQLVEAAETAYKARSQTSTVP